MDPTMLALSAATMMGRAAAGPAERPVVAMLLVIAGGVAFSTGAAGAVGRTPMLAVLMMLTLPSAFIGTGLLAVFLPAADLVEQMSKLAASDPLTRILNRRGFKEAAARAVASARRQGWPLTVVVADLDRFKAINDRFGHAAGDCAGRDRVTLAAPPLVAAGALWPAVLARSLELSGTAAR